MHQSRSSELAVVYGEGLGASLGFMIADVITFRMGPKVMLAAIIRLRDGLSVREACHKINALERRRRERFPEMGWSFIEPDLTD